MINVPTNMTATKPNCIICRSPPFNLDDFRRKSKGTKEAIKEKLSDQIRVIFILRNLLRIPRSVCEKYVLEKGNPSTWISTCSRCSIFVDEAFFVHRQIGQLQKKLNTFGVKARNEIRQRSCPKTRSSRVDSRILPVTEETQNFITQRGIETDKISDEDEDNLYLDERELILKEVPIEVPLISDEVEENEDPLQQSSNSHLIELGSPLGEWHDSIDSDGNCSVKEEFNSDNNKDQDYILSEDNAGSSDEDDMFPSITQVKSQAPLNTTSITSSNTKNAHDSTNGANNTKLNSKSVDLPYECDICNRRYISPKALRNHRKNIHNIYAEQEREPLELDIETSEDRNKNVLEESNSDKILGASNELNQEIPTTKPSEPPRRINKHKLRYRKFRRHCEVCKKVFPTLKELLSHRKDVHNLIPMGEKPPNSDQCEICGKKFIIYSSLRGHRLRVHGIRERAYIPIIKIDDHPWKCTECPEKFALDTERNEHEKTVHNKDLSDLPFGCLICSKRYRIKTELAFHYDVTHKPGRGIKKVQDVYKKYVCDKCPTSRAPLRFVTEDQLEKHILRVHLGDKTPYKCSVCGKGCRHPGHLRKHMQIHNGQRDFVCEVCGKRFTCSTLVAYHKLREHETEEEKPNPLRCDECKKIFSTKSYLRLHKATVHEKKFRYFCEVCGMGFQTLSNLKVHLLTHSGTNKPKKYCTKNRREKQKLQRETEIAANSNAQGSSSTLIVPLIKEQKNVNEECEDNEIASEKSASESPVIFRCEICPKANSRKYTDEEFLKRHIKKCHEGDKNPFKCKTCGKGCHSAGSLLIHSQTHTGERLFPCDLCDEKFTSTTYVKYHKNREHPEEGAINPFQCEICSRILASKTSLRMHKASIHEKTFQVSCEICGMGFQNRFTLKNHMKKHNKTNQKRKPYTCTKKRVYGIQLKAENPELGRSELLETVPDQTNLTTSLMEPEENVAASHSQTDGHRSEFAVLQSCIDFPTQFF